MDFSRLRQGEIIAGVAGVALFIFLFLDWFGAEGASINGWDSLGSDGTGFLVALASVAGMTLAGLAAMGRRLNIPLRRGAITAVLGYLALAIILWRILAVPEGAEIKFGLILGAAAALAITIGAVLALREDGFEPLVKVAGGRTRTATAASAPAATPRRATSAPKRATTSRSSGSRSKSSASRSKSSASRKTSTTRKRASGSKK